LNKTVVFAGIVLLLGVFAAGTVLFVAPETLSQTKEMILSEVDKIQIEKVVKTSQFVKPDPEDTQAVSEAGPAEEKIDALVASFLVELRTAVRDYRTQKSVLKELVDPFNMRSTYYAEENYYFSQSILPALRLKMDKIFKAFEKTDGQIKVLAKDLPEEKQKSVLEKWASLKKEQLNLYVHYFTYEERVVDGYEDLIAFYFQYHNQMILDSEFQTIGFADPSLENQEKSLLQKISNLKAEQKQVLAQNTQ